MSYNPTSPFQKKCLKKVRRPEYTFFQRGNEGGQQIHDTKLSIVNH